MRKRLVALVLALGAPACSSSSREISDGGREAEAATPPAGPYLTSLSVTSQGGSSGTPALALVPSFAPDVFDYYVRCAAGSNAVTVSMTASAGAEAALTSPANFPAAAQQTVSLSVVEDQAIVAVAQSGSARAEYWVRCLPYDFPPMLLTAHPENGTPPPGYYLVGNDTVLDARWGYAMVLDVRGVPVWYAHGRTGGAGVGDVDNLAPQTITNFSHFGYPVEVRKLTPPGTTYAAPKDAPLDGHELRVLPNGNFLIISDPQSSGVDLTGVRVPLGDGGAIEFGKNSTMIECNLVEFVPATGEVVWTWVGSKHIDPAKETVVPSLATPPLPDGGPVVETFHCNSIDVDEAGNLLVSARDMDALFYVERATGQILWKMGGVEANKDHATYVKAADPFHRQHDARLRPGWSPTCSGGRGQVSVFDDESNEKAPARGLLLDVVVGRDAGATGGDCGAPAAPGATTAWQYPGQYNSSALGSFRISPDGSRVVGWGSNVARGLVFTEVDVQGHDLLDFEFTQGLPSYRAVKVPISAFDIEVLRQTAGMP
jgi:hypothetical protein